MNRKEALKLTGRIAAPALGALCIALVAFRQQAFDSFAVTVIVYLIASLSALAVWFACVALATIGPIGRVTKLGEENPSPFWRVITVVVASCTGAVALFATIAFFQFLLLL